MKGQSVSRILMAVILFSVLAGTRAVAQPNGSRSRDRHCSNRTLLGDYGFAVEGDLSPGPGVTLTGRGVTMTHFDGEGNLTQVDSLIIGGNPVSDWSSVTGTYQVNDNCTGTMSLLTSTGGFVNLRMIVVRHGTEIHTVVWPPFDGPNRSVSSVGIKVE